MPQNTRPEHPCRACGEPTEERKTYCSPLCKGSCKGGKPPLRCELCSRLMHRGKGTAESGNVCMPCRKDRKKKHGTTYSYYGGCRCDLCSRANTVRLRRYYATYIPGVTGDEEHITTGWLADQWALAYHGMTFNEAKNASYQRQNPDAKTKRRPHRRGGDFISPDDRLALYERDDWTCWLCEEPIDPNISGKHSLGASLDHVIPKSKGGSDDFDNLRTAHRVCNSTRNNRNPVSPEHYQRITGRYRRPIAA